MKSFTHNISSQYIFMGTQTDFIINTYCTNCTSCEPRSISEYMASTAVMNAH